MSGTAPRRPVVAAFDVDGTVTAEDCVGPFLRRLGGWHGLLLAAARRPVATLAGGARRDRDALKEVFVGGVLRGRDVDAVARAGEAFAAEVAASRLRPDVLARLRWHQAEGHRTVLVSASLRPYLDPLGATLGVDAVLCTDVERRDGRYGDRLAGSNCRAAEKVARLRRWLDDEGLADAELWAYGDSAGDRELLAAAHRPTWVRGTTVQPMPADGGGPS